MKYKEFVDLLNQNNQKLLRFEYESERYVNPNFHITEVKNVSIDSVDCGGKSDQWNETILQLWNPESESERYPMKGEKALKILSIVDEIKTIDKDSEVYFEYGNETIRVSNFAIGSIKINDEFLTIQFEGLETTCKASNNKNSSCCTSESKLEDEKVLACCNDLTEAI